MKVAVWAPFPLRKCAHRARRRTLSRGQCSTSVRSFRRPFKEENVSRMAKAERSMKTGLSSLSRRMPPPDRQIVTATVQLMTAPPGAGQKPEAARPVSSIKGHCDNADCSFVSTNCCSAPLSPVPGFPWKNHAPVKPLRRDMKEVQSAIFSFCISFLV